MAKMIECHEVNPASECEHVVRGETEDELLKNAEVHAREHGLEPTPELMSALRSHIRDEPQRA